MSCSKARQSCHPFMTYRIISTPLKNYRSQLFWTLAFLFNTKKSKSRSCCLYQYLCGVLTCGPLFPLKASPTFKQDLQAADRGGRGIKSTIQMPFSEALDCLTGSLRRMTSVGSADKEVISMTPGQQRSASLG